ncbi:hypothetical protein TKK_0014673 [Trichogramma kaykai]|uniref:Uncharacterized protein n=1 Tax=Trichogramma kaykai TaxID=54128 RepID=A0ABD2WD82_9HYME
MNQLIQLEIEEVEPFNTRQHVAASSPNADHQNTISNEVLDYKKITQLRKELEESNTSHANASNRENRAYSESDNAFDIFRVHDKIFNYNEEKKTDELEYDSIGRVHLGFNVFCNAVAYNDAFKGKDAYKCLYTLSRGVYGLEKLSQMCVRSQMNTVGKEELHPLKKFAIERKVYAFMRCKDFTLSQIDNFLDGLNTAHGRVMTSAKTALKNQEKRKEKEKEINQRISDMENQINLQNT